MTQQELDALKALADAATQRAEAAEADRNIFYGEATRANARENDAIKRNAELEADAFVYRAILLTAALAAAYEWYSGYEQPLPPPVTLAQDAAMWFSDMAENARRAGAMAEADVNAMIRVQVTLEAMVAPQQATGGSEVQP